MPGFLSPGPTQSVVFIGAVDTVGRRASGTFADGGECGNVIDTSYPVGVVQVTVACLRAVHVIPTTEIVWLGYSRLAPP